jgi:hypothetical protein
LTRISIGRAFLGSSGRHEPPTSHWGEGLLLRRRGYLTPRSLESCWDLRLVSFCSFLLWVFLTRACTNNQLWEQLLVEEICFCPPVLLPRDVPVQVYIPSRSKKGTCLTTTLIPAGRKEPQSGTAFRTLDRFGLSGRKLKQPGSLDVRVKGGSKKSVNGGRACCRYLNFRFPVLTCSLMAGPGDVIGSGAGKRGAH